MPSSDVAQLAVDWWECQRRSAGNREERKELSLGRPRRVAGAADAVAERIDAGGRSALDLVVSLVDLAPDDAGLGLVGAGPLEDLINGDGEALLVDIKAVARTSERFRSALQAVYLPAAFEARLADLRD